MGRLGIFIAMTRRGDFDHTKRHVNLDRSTIDRDIGRLRGRANIHLLSEAAHRIILASTKRRLTLHLRQLLSRLGDALHSAKHVKRRLDKGIQITTDRAVSTRLVPRYVTRDRHHCPSVRFILRSHPRR